jgi:segregation and condensation protein B
MSDSHLTKVIEAALLASGRSLSPSELAQLFEDSARPAAAEVRAALVQLAADYETRGVEIKETASGFRVQVRREYATEVARLWPERPQRYSRALLETLALIAYRQPITRAEIEAVRGVAVNPNILKTLIERNWIRVVGQRDVPGRPELLGTTREFLDHFGLKTLDELPPLAELRSLAEINLQLPLPGTAEVDGAGDEPVLAAAALDPSGPAAAASLPNAFDAPSAVDEESADADGRGAAEESRPGLVASGPQHDD